MPAQATKTLLFLQGPPSTFWSELSDAFRAAGHRTLRVNISGGDLIYWRRPGAINYRGRLKNWRAFLADLCRREGVTDILYYADRLPYHIIAKEVGRELRIKVYAAEFGYLRPDWLTLEREGMGLYSHFPNDPEKILKAGSEVPPPPTHGPYGYSFNTEASNEVMFNLAGEFLRFLYPFYRADKYYHPFFDYTVWLRRLVGTKKALRHAHETCERLWTRRTSYYLLALQLQSDYQIRANSPYRHLSEMIEETIGSFARHAGPETELIVKIHPLDNGWENWSKVVRKIATRHGIADRVTTIDGGVLARLIEFAKGVVVVNSTVGIQSLRAGCPTKVLGVAVFDVPGMTHQGALDDFWTKPDAVNADLVRAFVHLLANSIQVKGSFYNPEGRAVAIKEFVSRILEERVNAPAAYVEPLPRWKRALAIGMRPPETE